MSSCPSRPLNDDVASYRIGTDARPRCGVEVLGGVRLQQQDLTVKPSFCPARREGVALHVHGDVSPEYLKLRPIAAAGRDVAEVRKARTAQSRVRSRFMSRSEPDHNSVSATPPASSLSRLGGNARRHHRLGHGMESLAQAKQARRRPTISSPSQGAAPLRRGTLAPPAAPDRRRIKRSNHRRMCDG